MVNWMRSYNVLMFLSISLEISVRILIWFCLYYVGFTDPVTTACCGMGKYNGIDGACRSIGRLCDDRTKSVFWDAFHPTESVNKICSEQFLSGGLDVVSPMNVKQLLAM